MHKILRRQLKKIFDDPDDLPEEIEELLEVVSDTYESYDEQNKLSKRTVDISSRELSVAIEELEKNKAKLDKEHEKVMHSINYAERMQRSILPGKEQLSGLSSEHFIIFQPKDLVSGDFFWIYEKDDCVFFAAVDCTGHGVPGAFMSIIGNDLLNELIISHSSNLGTLLDALHERVCLLLHQESTNNKDGMDIAICKWDKKNDKLYFAGAKNPLIYVDSTGINIIKADKKSIGGVATKRFADHVFVEHEVSITEPVNFYVFSDGFQDQFGGPEKRKFMQKRMRQMMEESYDKSMDDQCDLFMNSFNDWKKEEAQIDDILLMGIRLSPSN